MIRSSNPFLICAILLTSNGLPEARADQGLDNVPANLQSCVEEKDDTLRLACFDREVARLASMPAAPPSVVAVPTTAAAPVSQRSREEEFGQPPLKPEQKEEELMEITATVTKVQKSAGKVTVWLDNNQVWQQKYAGNFRVREGDKVTVKKKSLMGGYRLESRGRRTEVKRVK